jgi:hypothetical protein
MSPMDDRGNGVPGAESAETHANGKAGSAATNGEHVNGAMPDAAPEPSDANEPSTFDRVEEMMDEFGKKVGGLTSKLGQGLYLFGAHIRENLEDVWAEANELRKKNRSEPPASPPS